MNPGIPLIPAVPEKNILERGLYPSENHKVRSTRPWLRFLRLLVIYLTLGILLYFAFNNAPLDDIWQALARLHPWQIGVLLGVNALVFIFMSMRWWLIAKAERPTLPLLPLIGYRLAVFSMSYFTLGPQVGGEPLQIIFLRRHHNFSFARAVSTVILDKLLELLGNFVFIGLGLLAIANTGLLTASHSLPPGGWIVLVVLLAWPAIHLALLFSKKKPFSAVMSTLLFPYSKRKWYRLVSSSEKLAAAFTRRHPQLLLAALLASLISWTGMGIEFLLMLRFLHIDLNLWQAFAALTASLLAFLVPLPGGLGVLEASQVLALGAFGYSPATSISLVLLMRARDLINGGVGLWLAGANFRRII